MTEHAPPGHPDAITEGCTCPAMDNGHGQGNGWTDDEGNPLLWYSDDCPLHGGENAEPMAPLAMCYPE